MRRGLGWSALLMVLAQLLAAQCQAATPAGAGTADQDLKSDTLDLIAGAQSTVDLGGFPATTRANFYIGQRDSRLRLQTVSFAIDDGAPQVTPVDEPSAIALARSGVLRRVLRLNLQPGRHQVRAEFDYQALDTSQRPGPPQHVALSFSIDKTAPELDLVARLRPSGLFTAAVLDIESQSLQTEKSGWVSKLLPALGPAGNDLEFGPGATDPPARQHARFLGRIGQADAELVELLILASGYPDNSALPTAFGLQVVRAYRVAGLPEHARRIADSLERRDTDRGALSAERLALGEAFYNRGDLAQAEAQLLMARAGLPENLALDWRLALAQVYLRQQRTAEAMTYLKEPNGEYIDALRYLSTPVESLRAAAYRRYNLGVMLIRQNEVARGLSWLDLVGRLEEKDRDPELLALRDQANLALGWHFLEAKQGRTAVGILGRVRSDGLFSNAAVLGIGWAQLVPAGDRRIARSRLGDDSGKSEAFSALPAPMKNSLMQLHVLEPEQHGVYGPKSFERDSDPPADRNEGLRRALAYWRLLDGRDTHDAAIQEALLAKAYAFDQLKDAPQARAAYGDAARLLSSVRDELGAQAESIRKGTLAAMAASAPSDTGLVAGLAPLRLSPEASTIDLDDGLRRLRNLAELLRQLQDLQARLPAASAGAGQTRDWAGRIQFELPALQARIAAYGERVRDLALKTFEDRRRVLNEYLKVAYLAAARAEDPGTPHPSQ